MCYGRYSNFRYTSMIVACTLWKQSSKHHESSYGSSLSRRSLSQGSAVQVSRCHAAICQMYKFMYNTWAKAANQGATNWGAAFNAGMHITCVEKQHHRMREHCVLSIQIMKQKGQYNTQPIHNKPVAAPHTTHHTLHKHEWPQSSYKQTHDRNKFVNLGVSKECLGLKLQWKWHFRISILTATWS